MTSNSLTDSGIDRSIGWFLGGMGVIAFILLTVAGMGTMRRQAESVRADTDNRQEAVEVIDIGE